MSSKYAVPAAWGGQTDTLTSANRASGGAVPVASRLMVYEEALGDGELGLLYDPRDAAMLATQLERLVRDTALRERLHEGAKNAREALSWSHTTDAVEDLYREVAGRRHDPDGKPDVRKRLTAREFVHVDLHMHTDHSPDCATPVDVLISSAERAKRAARDALAR